MINLFLHRHSEKKLKPLPTLQTTSKFFKKKKLQMILFIAVIVILAVGAAVYTNFKMETVFTSIPKVVVWAANNLIPLEWDANGIRFDAKAIERFPNIVEKLIDTIFMSVMASITASVFSFCLALLGSRTTKINKLLAFLARGVSSVNRNIPIAAWAMIFLFSFGQSSFTGYLALFFYSFGFMSRVFTETIDEASASSVQALQATGASYSQVIAQAVLPSSLPQMVSWILYMIETNIRSSALVGILTGSGIGFIFSLYYKNFQYKSAVMVVLCIVVVVLLIEFLSNTLRRIIL